MPSELVGDEAASPLSEARSELRPGPSQSAKHGFDAQSAKHGFDAQSAKHGFDAQSAKHGFDAQSAKHGFDAQSAKHGFDAQSAKRVFDVTGREDFEARHMARPFALTERDFRAIAARVHKATGIVLGDAKRDLVYGRLSRRLRSLGCINFADYLDVLDGPDGEAEQAALVNAITTNLTGFFREPHHFEALQTDFLSGLINAPSQRRRLRIWSAGCSSGEEPYSIAMTVHQALGDVERWDARILATDIDTNMIATGSAGLYAADKANAIPATLRHRYARPAGADEVEMAASLKALIWFKPLNLLGAWPMRGPFDAIFCRNVVIYFDRDTQRTLFDRLADLLRPDGWLLIGHSESFFGISNRFQHLGRTIYRKVR